MSRLVTVAAVIGFNVGMYWVFSMQPAREPGTPSEPVWNCIMRASCPPIALVRAPWWFVPILNAILYAAITVAIGLFLRLVRPFLKGC
jgi:hypothetical protein